MKPEDFRQHYEEANEDNPYPELLREIAWAIGIMIGAGMFGLLCAFIAYGWSVIQ